ncbi:MAG: hypothetical protein UV59_C0013G0027 [Candidatus Gottesmanbacteria bacterium GW2011_GWA1_43_11]|uniref:Uncharacterized protein n=1 Tax=Candidatus Gottesmanbacteria bacterium GW2011_GWA1_43_11 TaxID=1618436 RepID=A0A0G1CH96_9BACT|nr:MAG: hypothetical protein UV59_C0013G0027 [Candidatus Gottesmanbacteria bacterium GW2011_GWA1_43_11]
MQHDMTKFTETLCALHTQSGLEFPFNGGSAYDHISELPELIKKQWAVRAGILESVQQEFADAPDVISAVKMFNELAPFIDRLFIVHLLKNSVSDVITHAWTHYDSKAATGLERQISSLFKNDQYRDFFHRNRETAASFKLVQLLIREDDPFQLDLLTRELERLAIQAYQNGKMIFLFCLSDYYTNPNGFARPVPTHPINRIAPVHFEPDMRLLYPSSDQQIKPVLNAGWLRLRYLHPRQSVPDSVVPTIIGSGLGWAGAQIISYTTAETLNSKGFVLSTNLFKHEKTKQALLHLLRQEEPKSLPYVTTVAHALHELGHEFYELNIKLFLEVAADIAACIVGTEMVTHNELPISMEDWVIGLLVENIALAQLPATGKDNEDGYLFSGRLMLNQLFAHKIIKFAESRLSIDDSPLQINEFLLELKYFHEGLFRKDPAAFLRLRTVIPDAQTVSLLQLIVKQPMGSE